MARSTPRTWVYNELVTAAIMNAHVRDQLNAYWPYTTAGDLAYASAADTIARLGIGTAGQVQTTNAGATAPEWAGGKKLIQEILLSGDGDLDFTSIPQYYKHLEIIIQVRGTTVANTHSGRMKFNADAAANYDCEISLMGLNTNEYFGVNDIRIGDMVAASGTANIANQATMWIANYTGTTFHKTVNGISSLKYNNIAVIQNHGFMGYWRSTAAITRITIFPSTDDYLTGSIGSLYGWG